MFIGRSLSNVCQNKRPYGTQNPISLLGIPSTDSRHNGKCNICAFHGKIHLFEDWIFVRLSVLASEWTTNRNKFTILSNDFDRFMTSEGSYTLILPFYSKMGQSVAQNRQNILICFTSKERTYFGIL